MSANTRTSDINIALSTRRRTPLGDALRQLLLNRAAVTGFIVIVLMVIVAVFADTTVLTLFTGGEPKPLIAPYAFDEVDFIYTDEPALTRTEEGALLLARHRLSGAG